MGGMILSMLVAWRSTIFAWISTLVCVTVDAILCELLIFLRVVRCVPLILKLVVSWSLADRFLSMRYPIAVCRHVTLD